MVICVGRTIVHLCYLFDVLSERKLKNFSKRTGNWKLIISTTWALGLEESCVVSTTSVSRNRIPLSRRRSVAYWLLGKNHYCMRFKIIIDIKINALLFDFSGPFLSPFIHCTSDYENAS